MSESCWDEGQVIGEKCIVRIEGLMLAMWQLWKFFII